MIYVIITVVFDTAKQVWEALKKMQDIEEVRAKKYVIIYMNNFKLSLLLTNCP